MLEKIEDSEKKRRPIPLDNRVMQVSEGATRIADATDAELAYLAGIIDGEGCVTVHRRNRRPEIHIKMKHILPYQLWEDYGGCIYSEDCARGKKPSLFYIWIVYRPGLLRQLAEAVMPFSRVKRRQLKLLLEAIDLKAGYGKSGKKKKEKVRSRIDEIRKLISELNHANPPRVLIVNR